MAFLVQVWKNFAMDHLVGKMSESSDADSTLSYFDLLAVLTKPLNPQFNYSINQLFLQLCPGHKMVNTQWFKIRRWYKIIFCGLLQPFNSSVEHFEMINLNYLSDTNHLRCSAGSAKCSSSAAGKVQKEQDKSVPQVLWLQTMIFNELCHAALMLLGYHS